LDTQEGESALMNTDSQPKKSLSRKRQLMQREETITRVTKNDWNPFERVDPKLLEKINRRFFKKQTNNYGEALL
jgi:hypothetical protein